MLRGGTTLETIAQGFTGSQEFINRFGTSTDRSAFVESLYVNGLGRASDAAGKAGWVNSNLTDEQLLLGFSESPESIARLDDATTTFLTNLSEGIAADTSASLTAVSDTTSSDLTTTTDSTESGGEGGGDGGGGGGGGSYARTFDDTVKDFVAGAGIDELLDVKAFDFATFTEVTSADSQIGDDTLIQLDIDNSVTLIGVSLGDVNSGDVII